MNFGIVLGTRPEIIKMAPVIDQINAQGHNYFLIHTGQHWDAKMSDDFFDELKIPKPDYTIMFAAYEGCMSIIPDEKPDMILVQGDTNSALVGAIAAKRLSIPLGHVEAGLRSYDKSMPEEVNRMMIDVCSDMLFAPTQDARQNLLKENMDDEIIFVTGNTIVDSINRAVIYSEKYTKYDEPILVTLHRPSNVDDIFVLTKLVEAVIDLSIRGHDIIWPVHPRAEGKLKEFALWDWVDDTPNIKIVQPLGYYEMLEVIAQAKLVITDSGGLQEETAVLKVPCITVRENTERPESIRAGINTLVTPWETQTIVDEALRIIETDKDYSYTPDIYGDGTAAERIVTLAARFLQEKRK